jgi:hypothetical protein
VRIVHLREKGRWYPGCGRRRESQWSTRCHPRPAVATLAVARVTPAPVDVGSEEKRREEKRQA